MARFLVHGEISLVDRPGVREMHAALMTTLAAHDCEMADVDLLPADGDGPSCLVVNAITGDVKDDLPAVKEEALRAFTRFATEVVAFACDLTYSADDEHDREDDGEDDGDPIVVGTPEDIARLRSEVALWAIREQLIFLSESDRSELARQLMPSLAAASDKIARSDTILENIATLRDTSNPTTPDPE